MAGSTDHQYIRARSALLDALDGLGPHRESIVLIGAQAIYLHTGDTEFSVAPFTYDADLALDSRSLASVPNIIEAMREAGFNQTDQPGIFTRSDHTQVDLLVPATLGGPGRRGARLGVHGNHAAMKVHGIEGALVDKETKRIAALDESDARSFTIKVAGAAALLVAKIHKMSERAYGPVRRQDDKDAFDIYRLLRGLETADLTASLNKLRDDELSGAVTREAVSFFEDLFCKEAAIGTQMVVRHVEGIEDPDFIAASCVSLSRDLLNSI
jgi:hypothetical protein